MDGQKIKQVIKNGLIVLELFNRYTFIGYFITWLLKG